MIEVFIAGPFKHACDGDNYRALQAQTIRAAGMRPIDPTSEEVNGDFRYVEQSPEIVFRTALGDIAAIERCDLVVLNAHRSSTGAGQESLLAAGLGKRVLVVTGESEYGVTRDEVSPWALFVADHVVDRLTVEALQHTASLSGQRSIASRLLQDSRTDSVAADELRRRVAISDGGNFYEAWKAFLLASASLPAASQSRLVAVSNS